jgi:membrane protease YdiL (CAAX protease family)
VADDSAPLQQPSRIPAYIAGPPPDDDFGRFKKQTGNIAFRRSTLTYLALGFLLLVYPGLSLGFMEDPSEMLESLNQGMLMVLLISTIVVQWAMFFVLFLVLFREQTGLGGLGFGRLRLIHLAWAVAFLIAANLILSGIAWLLAQVGLPMPGEIALLVPTDTIGRVVWVGVSITAGFCEETAFRGYLMTRLRLVGRFTNWVIPTILSAVAFGACHAYQGWPGLIVLSVYGALFSLLYIRAGSLWPCVIAHVFQDVMALFIPQ